MRSTKPGGDALSGYASASWATYNTVNAEAAVGGPLGGGFSFRASGLLQRRDDWVTNTSATGVADKKLEGYRDAAARLLLGYSSGDFNALVNFHVRDLEGTPRVFRAGLFKQGGNDFSPGFDKSKVALDGYTSQSMSQWGTNLHLDYHIDGVGTLYSVTAFEKADVESTGDIDGGNNYVFPALGLNNALFPSNTGGRTRPARNSARSCASRRIAPAASPPRAASIISTRSFATTNIIMSSRRPDRARRTTTRTSSTTTPTRITAFSPRSNIRRPTH